MTTTPSTVVVTGAGSGVGNATAVALVERGYRVFGTKIDDAEHVWVAKQFAVGISAHDVADAIVEAVTDDRPALRGDLQSNWFRDRILFRVVPVRPREAVIRRKLALDR